MKRFLIGLLSFFLVACDNIPSEPSSVEAQRSQAAQKVAQEQTYSYEVNNISKRRVLFGKPGVIGYVTLLNQAGQPVMYLTVDGKCTSAGKRLTQSERFETLDWSNNRNGRVSTGTQGNSWRVVQGPGEDGVYGTSEPYIYCFTTDGRYIQWAGDYLYSDKPFDLTIKPLVIDASNKLSHQ